MSTKTNLSIAHAAELERMLKKNLTQFLLVAANMHHVAVVKQGEKMHDGTSRATGMNLVVFTPEDGFQLLCPFSGIASEFMEKYPDLDRSAVYSHARHVTGFDNDAQTYWTTETPEEFAYDLFASGTPTPEIAALLRKEVRVTALWG